MNKLIQKPSEDPTKLPKAQQEHDDAKEVFDMLNDQLIAELPQLLDLRIPYFDPSFEAMIRMQCKFAEEGYEKLGGVQRCGRLFLASCCAAVLMRRFAADTLRTTSEMTMLRDNWMLRYVPYRFYARPDAEGA